LLAQGARAGCVEVGSDGAKTVVVLRGGADVVLADPSGALSIQPVAVDERLFVPRAWSCAVTFTTAQTTCLILTSEESAAANPRVVPTRRLGIDGLELRRAETTRAAGALVRHVYGGRGGHPFSFAQVNVLANVRGATRGFHNEGFGKYVGVLDGSAVARIIDLRPHSPSRGATDEIVLSGHDFVYVPPGCAHGFQAQQRDTQYLLCFDAEWQPARRYDMLGLHALGLWPLNPIAVPRDLEGPSLARYMTMRRGSRAAA
jgi:dTDP-4-dehydrorhamnose 3,5-epimerase